MFRRSYGNIPVRRYRIIRTIVAIAIAAIQSSGQNQALQIGRLTCFGLQGPKQKIEVTETIRIIIRKSGLRLNRKVQRTSCASLQNRGKTLKFFLSYFSALFPAALVSPPRLLGARPKNAKKKGARSACYSCTDRRNKEQTAVINI